MSKYWLFAALGSLFVIPAMLSVPIAAKEGQTYWILFVIFRSGNPNLFDAPVEWFFWAELLLPLAFSVFCLVKAQVKS